MSRRLAYEEQGFKLEDLRRVWKDSLESVKEFAAMLGIHRRTAYEYLKQLGIKSHPGGGHRKLLLPNKYIKMWREKFPGEPLPRKFGVFVKRLGASYDTVKDEMGVRRFYLRQYLAKFKGLEGAPYMFNSVEGAQFPGAAIASTSFEIKNFTETVFVEVTLKTGQVYHLKFRYGDYLKIVTANPSEPEPIQD